MKHLTRFISVIFILVSLFCFSACSNENKVLEFTEFNTLIRIETHDKAMMEQTQRSIKVLFSELDGEFDANSEDSFIYNLNNSKGGTTFQLSQAATKILSLAKSCLEYTDGKFNPAVYPLVKLWGFAPFNMTVTFTPPNEQRIQAVKATIDFSSIRLDEEKLSVTKVKDDTQIELGGILKGYACDEAAEILKQAGHNSGYINVGGSSLNILATESLGVKNPRADGTAITVNLKGKNNIPISSSGDYERYYEYEGKRYSHIIDASTGYPYQTGISGATLIGCSGAFGDALTTALCLSTYTPNDFNSPLVLLMKKIISDYEDCSLFIFYDGEVRHLITNKIQGKDFTLHDDGYTVVKI